MVVVVVVVAVAAADCFLFLFRSLLLALPMAIESVGGDGLNFDEKARVEEKAEA